MAGAARHTRGFHVAAQTTVVVNMKLAPLILALALSGCATTERYLTEEQDREMRETCVDGCMVVAGPAWEQLRKAVKMCGLGDI